MNKSSTVRIVLAGGATCLASWNPNTQTMSYGAPTSAANTRLTTALSEIAKKKGVTATVVTAFPEDSTNVTDEDRQTIADAINGTKEKCIVVLHPSEGRAETATYLAENTDLTNRTLVFTDGNTPMVMHAETEGSDSYSAVEDAVQKATENEPTAEGSIFQYENGTITALQPENVAN